MTTQEIAQHAINILINLTATEDKIILENVATDDRFLGILFGLLVVRITINHETAHVTPT